MCSTLRNFSRVMLRRGQARGFNSANDDVLLTRSANGHFASITLNRTEVHNALSPSVMTGIEDSLLTLRDDYKVRAVFLKASGATFCAGGDLKHMKSTANWTYEQNKAEAFRLSGVFNAIRNFPRPIIALVNGPAYGGGVGLISSCDMAFAVQTAVFALSEVTLGVIPATISPFVISKIGATASRRYFLTAERFDADEAKFIGLVNDVVADEAALSELEAKLMKSLMRCSPSAMSASKGLIEAIDGRVVDEKLRMWTAQRLADVRESADGQEGMGAFLEKRKPSWTEE
ncbi:AKT6-1 [Symbiodinium microadriaticum]|nr:AKT6-1 [Symbiodinium microadriaticum]